jgi:hypothetical protein
MIQVYIVIVLILLSMVLIAMMILLAAELRDFLLLLRLGSLTDFGNGLDREILIKLRYVQKVRVASRSTPSIIGLLILRHCRLISYKRREHEDRHLLPLRWLFRLNFNMKFGFDITCGPFKIILALLSAFHTLTCCLPV